jgi:hypothetical protein
VSVHKPEPSLVSGKALPVRWEDELVRWVARGSRRASTGDAGPADDGLDGLSWDVLCQSVAAAHRGDAQAHAAPLLRYEREVPRDTRAGVYLWYLLRYRVAELLGRRPSPEDLHALAERSYPAFARLIRGDRSQLEDTLFTVFGLACEGRKVGGGMGVVMGSAALGVLLDDPETELAAMRPHLAQWRRASADEFRDLEGG